MMVVINIIINAGTYRHCKKTMLHTAWLSATIATCKQSKTLKTFVIVITIL